MRYFYVGLLVTALLACTTDGDTTSNNLPSCDKPEELQGLCEYVKQCNLPLAEYGCGLAEVSTEAKCGDCIQEGSWYRFTELKLTSLDESADHPAVIALNGFWASDVALYDLNVAFQVTSIDQDKIVLQVYPGARNDLAEGAAMTGGDTCDATAKLDGDCCSELQPQPFCTLGEGVTLSHERTGCSFAESGPIAMNIYAGAKQSPKTCNPGTQKHGFEALGVMVTAQHADACEPIEEDVIAGSLLGVVSQTALAAMCTCLTPGSCSDKCGIVSPDAPANDSGECAGCGPSFVSLMTTLKGLTGGQDLNYTCKTPAGDPGACITADFKATRLKAAPEACK